MAEPRDSKLARHVALGMCLGLPFGAALDNVALGLPLGMFGGLIVYGLRHGRAKDQ